MLRIGTVNNEILKAEANRVKAQLVSANPELVVEVEVIDQDYNILDTKLLDKNFDLVICDVQNDSFSENDGIRHLKFWERLDNHVVLISNNNTPLTEMNGCVAYVDEVLLLQLEDINNKIQYKKVKSTSDALKLLKEHCVDGIVVDKADLILLENDDEISEVFDYEQILPLCGKGSFSIKIRNNDEKLAELLNIFTNEIANNCILCEHRFMTIMEADNEKLGANCYYADGEYHLSVVYCDDNHQEIYRIMGSDLNPIRLAERLVFKMQNLI